MIRSLAMCSLLLVACGSGSAGRVPVDPEPPMPTPKDPAVPPTPPTEAPHPWPTTRVGADVETRGGKTIKDPYRWLEDASGDGVQAWMTAQDEVTRAALGAVPERAELAKRLHELFYYDAISAPQTFGGRVFYTRKHADKEKSIVYWKQGEHGAEQVLFDPNGWSADGSKGLGGWWPSWDGKRVAYSIKENNSDETVMHVLEVATGKDTADVIAGTKYSGASWTPDGKGFYYIWVPQVFGETTIANRPGFAEMRYHPLAGPRSARPSEMVRDRTIHEATKNPQTFLGGGLSRDGHWLVASIEHGWNSSDVFFKDARKPSAPWTTLVSGIDASFSVTVWKDVFYVSTNHEAPRGRLFRVDPKHPARADWKQIIAEGEATLESFQILGGKLVLTYLRNATSQVEVHELDGTLVRTIPLPGLGTVGGVTGQPDLDTIYLAYSSFTDPSIILKSSVKTGATSEWTRVDLPFDSSQFVTDQVFYPSKDGTKVSMFIIHKKDVTPTGDRPTILYGYGGFQVSLTPGFSSSRAVWLERGGVYAIPNLRGGGEYGEEWHRHGMLLEKQNVFDDFIGAAEFLIASKWTSKDHLAIQGGSNGGLLVGATMAQRPELFKAVVCSVPLLDMLRFHLFGSGATWVPEYGSADDPAQFAALWAYSPYRVVVDAGRRAYPALLMDSADHDDRVDPMHARKLVAAIQANQTAAAPVLLRIERNSGHGGADMVKSGVERSADTFAFLWTQLR